MSEPSHHQEVRVRVAPSPTGDPHVGTAYMALFNRAYARCAGGKFVLRIEDTDQERTNPESEAAIFKSLRWLGLEWDEGPDVGGPFGPYRQSERRDIYNQHIQLLIENESAYRCFCTKERLDELRAGQRAEKGRLGYDGLCRSVDQDESLHRAESDEPFVVRLRVPDEGKTSFRDQIRRELIEFDNSEIDDQVLTKSDGWPTYHLASVVDDHVMQISDVVRAEEWITSTPKHVLLYQAFGWEMPRFFHMPLLRNQDQSKISKRKNPTSLEWYRTNGYLPETMVNFLGLMGYSMPDEREEFTFDEMVAEFEWKRVKTSGPIFDFQKLDWLNGAYIRSLSLDELGRRLVDERFATAEQLEIITPVMAFIQERLKTLNEFEERTAFFFKDDLEYEANMLIPKKRDAAFATEVLAEVRSVLETLESFATESTEAALRALGENAGWKTRDLFMPIRGAVTGSTQSPPLFESMEVIGKERCLKRIDEAIAKLKER